MNAGANAFGNQDLPIRVATVAALRGGFLKMKNDGKIVCLAFGLYFKNNSFRQIADTLSQFYSVKVDHSTILCWAHRFVQVAKDFVDSLPGP
jgi:hypothetical protein